MSTWVRVLVVMCLMCSLGMTAVADDSSDATIVEQLTPAQLEKWNAASEKTKADWRVRWQMRQESEARVGRDPSQAKAAKKPANEAPIPDGPDIGRLRYDTGAPADLFHTNGGNTDAMVGNRFTANTLTNTTLTMFTVTGMSIYGRSAAATMDPFDPGFSFLNPPAGTTAGVIGYRGAASNFPQSAFSPQTIATIQVPRTFLAAMYQGTFAGSDELGMVTDSRVATMGTMTTPLGFHAFQADFNSGTSTGYAAIAGQNAMLRVRGPAILPVELISFELE